MVFNRHLKALNLCNHSDTIACVLYELLVNLELINVGFQTHDQGSTSFSFVQFSRSCCAVSSRWQLVNYTTSGSVCQELFWSFFGFFEGFSVLFNFQGPAALSRFRNSLYIIYQILSFVKRFSESFLKKFSSKNSYKLYLKASAAVPRAPPARQLWYITTPPYTLSTPFFGFFDKFWGRYLGKVYIAEVRKYDY